MSFITQGRTNIKYILIVLILATLVGGGILAYQYWWLPKHEIKPPEITINYQTANWQTYRNEEYGYELKYPNDFKIEEEYGGITYLSSAEYPDTFISIRVSENLSVLLHGMFAQYSEKDPLHAEVYSEKSGDFIKGYFVAYSGFGESSWGTAMNAYQYKNGVYYIVCLSRDRELGFPGVEDVANGKQIIDSIEQKIIDSTLVEMLDKNNEYTRIFDQILSTFKFIEPADTTDWQTYRNEEYGFELKYPPGWMVVADSAAVQPPDIELQKENKEALGDFSLLITQIKEIPNNNLEGYVQNIAKQPDEVYEKYCSPYLPRLITLSFEINGEKAFRMYSCGVGGGIPSEDTFVSNGKGGAFNFSCLVNFEGYPDYSKYHSSGECDNILKTFKTF